MMQIIEQIDLREDDYSDLVTRDLMHIVWDRSRPWCVSLENTGYDPLESAEYCLEKSVWRVCQTWTVDQQTACWLWLKHPDMFVDEPYHKVYLKNDT